MVGGLFLVWEGGMGRVGVSGGKLSAPSPGGGFWCFGGVGGGKCREAVVVYPIYRYIHTMAEQHAPARTYAHTNTHTYTHKQHAPAHPQSRPHVPMLRRTWRRSMKARPAWESTS